MVDRLLKPLKTNSFFLFGARGTGKTTLLGETFSASEAFFINLLENETCAQLQARPDSLEEVTRMHNREWCIIDEVQKVPALLDVVHRLIEERPNDIDLILERPGHPTCMIEIKSNDRVNEMHCSSLKKLSPMIYNSQCFLLSRSYSAKAG